MGLLIGNLLTLLAVAASLVASIFSVVELLMLSRFFGAVGAGVAMCALVLFLQVWRFRVIFWKPIFRIFSTKIRS